MKRILCALTAFLTLIVCTSARADIFKPIGAPDELKVSEGVAIPGVDSGTILAEVAQITSYLGVREGFVYDFGRHEFANYAAATAITFAQYGISVDLGAINTDGVAETIDWNVGAFVPADNVPLLNLVKYLYIGGGIAEREIDGDWKVSGVLDAQFKFTF